MWVESLIKRYVYYLESKGALFNFCIGMICSLIVIFMDTIDGDKYNFSFFYLFPISLTTWFAGRIFGVVVALLCSIAWAVDNHSQDLTVLIWNTLSTISVFVVISVLVHKVRILWEQERKQSQIDFLTGCLNSRAFHGILEYEIHRMKRERKPLTIAYIDLDNFKHINDQFGHLRGDELLKFIVVSVQTSMRKTDVIARVGGDEFVILFPNTDEEAARIAVNKIKDSLRADMMLHHWATTFSIGVVTCLDPPSRSEELITLADNYMYEVKRNGKNGIKFMVYG